MNKMDKIRYELIKLKKIGPLTEDALKAAVSDKSNRLSKLIPKDYFRKSGKMLKIRVKIEAPAKGMPIRSTPPEKPKRIKIK